MVGGIANGAFQGYIRRMRFFSSPKPGAAFREKARRDRPRIPIRRKKECEVKERGFARRGRPLAPFLFQTAKRERSTRWISGK
jgi:hypothetical protein